MYKTTIGLEIHIELNTKSKMFCSCKNDPDEKRPNTNICPVCMGHPGTLPVINGEAVRKVIKTGIALNCRVPEYSKFDRKNYFYPDLPKGYQISQYDKPLTVEGYLDVDGRRVRIRRVHLEEDTGRLIHSDDSDYSLVDFNRAGIPLMELVTEPDMNSAKEARHFAEELQRILRYINVSDGDMEKGQLRVEANISLSPDEKLGTKAEIKNLNSFRVVEKAIDYEIKRQSEVLDKKGKIIQETRGWDENRGATFSQREKEEAQDYRYFPEPDLPPLHIIQQVVDQIKCEIPELPYQKRERFIREYELDEKSVEVYVANKDLSEYFEKTVSEMSPRLKRDELSRLIKLASNYIITDLQGLFEGKPFIEKECKIDPENFAEFITLIHSGEISSKIAKMVLEEMFRTGGDPSNIIDEKGLSQITDEAEIGKAIDEVISKNPATVQDFKKGKSNAFQFLIGQVMAKTKGKANPQAVGKILKEKLS